MALEAIAVLHFNSDCAIGFPDLSQPVLTFLRGSVAITKSGCLEIEAKYQDKMPYRSLKR